MSDGLIEKLEAFQEKSEIYACCDEDDEIWQDCGKYVLDNLPAILSALKTVRGIEGITNTEGNSVTFVHKNADFNGLPNCCIVVTTDWSNEQTYRADTFAECVEAAGKKGEGRDG